MKITTNNQVWDEKSSPLEYVLEQRGIKDVEKFFDIGWDSVNPPNNLEDLSLAIDLITAPEIEKICVLIDSDTDGFTSAAVLINYLVTLKLFNINQFYPIFHSDKQHGLADTKIMCEIRDLQPDLIIIPDASGTLEQYKALSESIPPSNLRKILVLDHHPEMEKTNPYAIVINDKNSPRYTNHEISGAGIVWQFCRALDEHFNTSYANDLLDLVAIGLVADVMDLRNDETRFLVNSGIENIKHPFLINCISNLSYNIKENLTPSGISFYIAPLFNSVIRIGTQEEKELLFKALIYDYCSNLILSGKRGETNKEVPLCQEVFRQITNAKSRQKRRQDKFMKLLEDFILENKLTKNKVMIIPISKRDSSTEDKNITGLVANALQDLYKRPVLILHENDKEYSGSFRAPSNIEAYMNFKTQLLETDLCNWAQGHEYAAGVGISEKNILNLQEYFNTKYQEISTDPVIFCDFTFPAEDERLQEIVLELAKFKGWGTGIEEPKICITDFVVCGNMQLLSQNKNPTLLFKLQDNLDAIKFRSSLEEFEALVPPRDNVSYYNLILTGKCNLNEYNGRIKPQIFIENYEVVGKRYVF